VLTILIAVAAVTQAVATVVLVCVTRRYVHLTNRLVEEQQAAAERLWRPFMAVRVRRAEQGHILNIEVANRGNSPRSMFASVSNPALWNATGGVLE